MTIEVVLHKRKARYPGEIGIFADHPAAEDDFRLVTMNSDVLVKFSSARTVEQNKYMWGLATLVANNTDLYRDKDDARDDLLRRARHCKFVFSKRLRKMELIPKSTRRLSEQQFKRLNERLKYVVLTEIIPEMKAKDLQDEMIRMCGG